MDPTKGEMAVEAETLALSLLDRGQRLKKELHLNFLDASGFP